MWLTAGQVYLTNKTGRVLRPVLICPPGLERRDKMKLINYEPETIIHFNEVQDNAKISAFNRCLHPVSGIPKSTLASL